MHKYDITRQRAIRRPARYNYLTEERLKKADCTRDDRYTINRYQRLVSSAEAGRASAGKNGCGYFRKCFDQNNPLINPLSSMSIFSAEGTAGRPGMRMIDPEIALR